MPDSQPRSIPEQAPPARARRPAPAPARSSSRWLRFVKRGALIAILLAAAGGMIYVWLPEPIPVDLARVERGPLRVTVDQDGRTRVKDRYVVSAPLLASSARIELQPGSAVKAGQVVARLLPLEPPLLDARTRAQSAARVAATQASRQQAETGVARAQAAFELAQREAARQRELSVRGAAAESMRERAEIEERALRESLASANFAARVADYEVRMARLALDRQTEGTDAKEQIEIVAPVDGQVLRVMQESAGVVQPGTPLLEIGDLNALEIVADVLTREAIQILPGARVEIQHWGGAVQLPGRVRAVEPSAFTRLSALGVEEQRVNVVVDLDAPREVWKRLGDGYRVELAITVWEAEDVLSAPAGAVFRDRDRWVAYEAKEGRVRLAVLELGQRNAERVEIAHGLSEGAQVVVHPSERLADGSRVELRR